MNKQVKYLFAIIIVAFAICLEIYHFPMQSQSSITRDKDTYDITSIDDNAIALAGTMPTDQTAQLAALDTFLKGWLNVAQIDVLGQFYFGMIGTKIKEYGLV